MLAVVSIIYVCLVSHLALQMSLVLGVALYLLCVLPGTADVILEGAGVAVGRQRPGGGKKGGGTRGSGSSLFMAATEVDER